MQKILLTAVVCIFLLFSACSLQEDNTIEIRTSADSAAQDPAPSEGAPVLIAVYICGEVNVPGVYYLEDGSRIADAVAAAGGTRENADLRSINLAQRLSDGQQIVVNGVPEEGSSLSAADTTSPSGKVNLNRATKEDLMMLPGIGESKADAIIRYRDEVGWIVSADEIMNISGIKEKVYERISGLIEV